jgi:hypothetical protein
VEEDELLLESDSDSNAEKRSCMNCPIACRGSWVEVVESVDEAELVEEVEPSEVEFALEFGGGPFGGGGIEIPIWLNACMMLCINVSFPPCPDPEPET